MPGSRCLSPCQWSLSRWRTGYWTLRTVRERHQGGIIQKKTSQNKTISFKRRHSCCGSVAEGRKLQLIEKTLGWAHGPNSPLQLLRFVLCYKTEAQSVNSWGVWLYEFSGLVETQPESFWVQSFYVLFNLPCTKLLSSDEALLPGRTSVPFECSHSEITL